MHIMSSLPEPASTLLQVKSDELLFCGKKIQLGKLKAFVRHMYVYWVTNGTLPVIVYLLLLFIKLCRENVLSVIEISP